MIAIDLVMAVSLALPAHAEVPGRVGALQDPAPVVRGRLLDRDGAPVAEAAVFLMPSVPDPVTAWLQLQQVPRPAPVATTRSGADGAFALPLPDLPVDLFVCDPRVADTVRRHLRPADGPTVDLGDLRLASGVRITGVVHGPNGRRLGGVAVRLVTAAPLPLLEVAPGRERGLVATTDANGCFVLPHVPAGLRCTLHVEAMGCFRASRTATSDAFARDVLKFGLEEHASTAGLVVDRSGRPVPGARVCGGRSQAGATLGEAAFTAPDGSFALSDLEQGAPCRLTIAASGFFDLAVAEVTGGSGGHRFELERLPAVRLRVFDAAGAPVSSYRVRVRRVTRSGAVEPAVVLERDVTAGDLAGDGPDRWLDLAGVPAGAFALVVLEDRHAPTSSAPFTIARGASPALDVRLWRGATIRGVVVGADGAPVVDAAVATDANDAPGLPLPSGPTASGPRPSGTGVTRASVRTDAQGRFSIGRLAPGAYMLRVRHPDWCGARAFDLEVKAGDESVDAGVVRLLAGAVVVGTVTANTRARVRIGLAPEPAAGQDWAPGDRALRLWAVADERGAFRFLERVPPGRYLVWSSPVEEVAFPMRQVREFRRPLVVEAGVAEATVDLRAGR